MCANHAPVVISLNTVLHVPQSSWCLLRVPRWEGGREKRTRFKVRRSGFKPSLLLPPWTAAQQAPQSMGFPRQEYWSGLLFPSPGDLPHPGIKPMSPALAGGFFSTERTGKQVRVPPLLFNSMVSGCTSHLNLSFYTHKIGFKNPCPSHP